MWPSKSGWTIGQQQQSGNDSAKKKVKGMALADNSIGKISLIREKPNDISTSTVNRFYATWVESDTIKVHLVDIRHGNNGLGSSGISISSSSTPLTSVNRAQDSQDTNSSKPADSTVNPRNENTNGTSIRTIRT